MRPSGFHVRIASKLRSSVRRAGHVGARVCPSKLQVSRMCCRQCLWPVGLTDQNQTACWPQAGYLTTRLAYGPCGAAIRRRAAGGSHRHHAVCNPCAQAEPASSVRAAFGGTVACREPSRPVSCRPRTLQSPARASAIA